MTCVLARETRAARGNYPQCNLDRTETLRWCGLVLTMWIPTIVGRHGQVIDGKPVAAVGVYLSSDFWSHYPANEVSCCQIARQSRSSSCLSWCNSTEGGLRWMAGCGRAKKSPLPCAEAPLPVSM